jgi:hypothetical protein
MHSRAMGPTGTASVRPMIIPCRNKLRSMGHRERV